ncbi:cytochrome c oxidase subunit 3 [Rhabdothermincola sediminis]|uniref:cytochrome c oxidase subunit 3 n=1 Tax=Rhabdothermincola sediminis TaxID=2751370 RepID=UPI001AA06A05|nr:cytochrome c oxidase subunit 3 [Rhabdothermincola sediminis]
MAVTHALPPAPPLQRPRVLMVASGFASAAALMLFGGLLGIYLTRRAELLQAGDTWLPEGVTIPLQQPNVMLFTLLASAITMQWAVYAVARDDRVNTYIALGLTFVFGIAYVNMQSYLYTLMKFDVIANQQAVLVYTITGAHLAMLVAAMIFTAVMAFRALGGRETSRQHDGVSAAALFWHAMVVAYAILWYAIYITK